MRRRVRNHTEQLLCGIALFVFCTMFIIISKSFGETDITPVFILVPLGIYTILDS